MSELDGKIYDLVTRYLVAESIYEISPGKHTKDDMRELESIIVAALERCPQMTAEHDGLLIKGQPCSIGTKRVAWFVLRGVIPGIAMGALHLRQDDVWRRGGQIVLIGAGPSSGDPASRIATKVVRKLRSGEAA